MGRERTKQAEQTEAAPPPPSRSPLPVQDGATLQASSLLHVRLPRPAVPPPPRSARTGPNDRGGACSLPRSPRPPPPLSLHPPTAFPVPSPLSAPLPPLHRPPPLSPPLPGAFPRFLSPPARLRRPRPARRPSLEQALASRLSRSPADDGTRFDLGHVQAPRAGRGPARPGAGAWRAWDGASGRAPWRRGRRARRPRRGAAGRGASVRARSTIDETTLRSFSLLAGRGPRRHLRRLQHELCRRRPRPQHAGCAAQRAGRRGHAAAQRPLRARRGGSRHRDRRIRAERLHRRRPAGRGSRSDRTPRPEASVDAAAGPFPPSTPPPPLAPGALDGAAGRSGLRGPGVGERDGLRGGELGARAALRRRRSGGAVLRRRDVALAQFRSLPPSPPPAASVAPPLSPARRIRRFASFPGPLLGSLAASRPSSPSPPLPPALLFLYAQRSRRRRFCRWWLASSRAARSRRLGSSRTSRRRPGFAAA